MRRILSQAEQFSWRVANDTPADLVLPPGAATRYEHITQWLADNGHAGRS